MYLWFVLRILCIICIYILDGKFVVIFYNLKWFKYERFFNLEYLLLNVFFFFDK